MSLTPKQARFVEEYLIDLNATQAAVRAGYAEKRAAEQGYQLLQKTTVRQAIEKGQAEIAARNDVTQVWLIAEFKENHRLARCGNPVIDRYGNPTGGVMRQISASNKALESIAVITGHWVDRHRVGGDPDNPVMLQVVTGVPEKEA